MADELAIQDARAEIVVREESRFEQTWSKSTYCSMFGIHFPPVREETGIIRYDITEVTRHLGFEMPVFISGSLYRDEIMNQAQNPIKNVETLCHAFMYAVDCDTHDRCILDFQVPGNGSASYKVSAHLRGFGVKSILLEHALR